MKLKLNLLYPVITLPLFVFNSCKKEEKKPNVIVFYIDDLDFTELSLNNPQAHTPCIDSLAKDGVVLNHFYVSSAVSSPSRYSALTGRYASYSSNFDSLSKKEPVFIRWNADIKKDKDKTISYYLKSAGYTTGFVGKWHNGQPIPEEQLLDINPLRPDLNQFLHTVYEKQRSYIKNVTDFDYVERIYGNNLHVTGLPKSMQFHNMEWITEGTLNFIGQNKDKPFFLWMATTSPHLPNPYESLLADPRITPSGILKKEISGVQPSRKNLLHRIDSLGIDHRYAGMMWVDDAIRVVIEKLKKENLLDNTLIIFASDNGAEKGKMTCYETAAHMPAFIYWKGKIKPGKSDELTSNIDFVPTILDFCKVDTKNSDQFSGLSWKKNLLEGKPLERSALYLEVVYQRAVVTKQWKYIATRFPKSVQKELTSENRKLYSIEGKKEPDRYANEKDYPAYFDDNQLYDLTNDANEKNNLYNNPQHIKEKNQMTQLMKDYCKLLPFSFGEFAGEK